MSAPHDNPTAAELTAAVRDWLADDVGTADGPPNRFHLRVATNVLDMVAREIELGPQQAEAHAARLERLGASDDRELADAIRSGTIDYRDESVRDLIWDSVVDKLAVANPSYLERNPR